MLNFNTRCQIAVIDEIQMITDPQGHSGIGYVSALVNHGNICILHRPAAIYRTTAEMSRGDVDVFQSTRDRSDEFTQIMNRREFSPCFLSSSRVLNMRTK